MPATDEIKSCKNCSRSFVISNQDKEFYEKIDVPHPTHCPECRQQRRFAFRNEKNLYHRKCDLTGENIISNYSPDKPFKIYKMEEWRAYKWDPMQYGKPYDFSKPFFAQFRDLQLAVPRPSLVVAQLENSPYVNQCWNTKNSYMCFDMGFVEDAIYCHSTYHCKDVVDTLFTRECELSYNLIDCQRCYNCFFLQDCSNCHDSYFSFDCKGCENTAFCSNLRNKANHIFNKPVSKETFENFVKEFKEGSHSKLQKFIAEFKEKVLKNAIRLYTHNLNTENCSGDYIINSKNCTDCYVCDSCQDIKYCTYMDEKINDSMDINHAAMCELCYECLCINGTNIKFSTLGIIDTNDCMYCDFMTSSGNCFGCIGLKHKNYCILNKQYTKEAFGKLRLTIIEHMRKTGEFGEFFPINLSPFAYNETTAYEDHPLTREEALKKGCSWKEKDMKNYQKQTYKVPDKIADITPGIISEILACADCGKNYKIIEQELNFYKKMSLPIPIKCPDCRHMERMGFRTPHKFFENKCAKCGIELKTTYSPEKPKTIYCEKCYLETVY